MFFPLLGNRSWSSIIRKR